MQITLKQITPNALEFIGELAGICYNSKNEPKANVKRAIHCKESGHLATLRFATATFHVQGISRACSHQMVRSKFLDFLQRSQRYCSEKDTSFVVPTNLKGNIDVETLYEHSLGLYQELLKKGVKKEDARFVLPEATTTELIVTGNFQAWIDFIKLRADTHAQWEVREVAKTINNILSAELDNNVFHWMP